jgi:hypothetical protein
MSTYPSISHHRNVMAKPVGCEIAHGVVMLQELALL